MTSDRPHDNDRLKQIVELQDQLTALRDGIRALADTPHAAILPRQLLALLGEDTTDATD